MPVLPRATTKLSAASYSRLGNRVVCEPAEWSTLERELREHLGQALPPELMHKYVLSTATWAKLPDDPDGFVSARHADLEEMELRHLEVMAARFGFAREVLGS